MSFRVGLALAWVVATCASILIAFAAVASVRSALAEPDTFHLDSAVTESIAAAALAGEPAVTTAFSEAGDQAVPPGPRAGIEGSAATTTSTVPTSTSSSTPTSVPNTTSTTESEASPAPPTTRPPAATALNTYEVDGGWVTLRSDNEGVYLESASPRAGWTVKVEGQGPKEVVVVFKTSGQETHFIGKFENGEVRIKVEN